MGLRWPCCGVFKNLVPSFCFAFLGTSLQFQAYVPPAESAPRSSCKDSPSDIPAYSGVWDLAIWPRLVTGKTAMWSFLRCSRGSVAKRELRIDIEQVATWMLG
jgi:hypothetical protein